MLSTTSCKSVNSKMLILPNPHRTSPLLCFKFMCNFISGVTKKSIIRLQGLSLVFSKLYFSFRFFEVSNEGSNIDMTPRLVKMPSVLNCSIRSLNESLLPKILAPYAPRQVSPSSEKSFARGKKNDKTGSILSSPENTHIVSAIIAKILLFLPCKHRCLDRGFSTVTTVLYIAEMSPFLDGVRYPSETILSIHL